MIVVGMGTEKWCDEISELNMRIKGKAEDTFSQDGHKSFEIKT